MRRNGKRNSPPPSISLRVFVWPTRELNAALAKGCYSIQLYWQQL